MVRLRNCRRSNCFILMGMAVTSLFCLQYSWLPAAHVKEVTGSVRIKPTHPPARYRHEKVREVCQSGRPSNSQRSPGVLRFPMDPLISLNPKIFFCPLAKAGSTFFTRYFMAMNLNGPMTNPYRIGIREASRQKQATFASLHPLKLQQEFLQQSFKFVFTRNPYSRIFSAYVDKLFSPNPYYWHNWGTRAVVRNKLDQNDHPCGSQVSFKDFVKIVIASLWKTDLHFIPMDAMCKFCDVDYDFVGHIEQSDIDIELLSKKINVSSAFLHEKSYKRSAMVDTIKDSTEDAISTWKKDISKCISIYDSGRIVWRKLQLRGVIDADINFPFDEEKMESVGLDEFRQECYKAVNNSRNPTRLKRQKSLAIQFAYSSLPQQDIGRLQQIYKRDFMLLTYDMTRPDASISGSGGVETSDPFDWRSSWVFE